MFQNAKVLKRENFKYFSFFQITSILLDNIESKLIDLTLDLILLQDHLQDVVCVQQTGDIDAHQRVLWRREDRRVSVVDVAVDAGLATKDLLSGHAKAWTTTQSAGALRVRGKALRYRVY